MLVLVKCVYTNTLVYLTIELYKFEIANYANNIKNGLYDIEILGSYICICRKTTMR